MLNKERSAGRARLRLLLVLPIAGGMLGASTMAFTKDYAMVDLYPKKYGSMRAIDQDTLKKSKAIAKKTVTVKLAPPPMPTPPPTKKISSTTQGKDVIKFPPPIAVPDKKVKSTSSERRQVKFPPPILKDKKNEVPPPPPPMEMKKNI